MITPQELRTLEAQAAGPTSKAIRKALLDAAEALEARENGSALNQLQQACTDVAATLDEIALTRISQTMTEHRAAEIVADNNRKLQRLAIQLRELRDA